MVYARHSQGRSLTFDFADGLVRNNLLMVDRETRSVWSQLHGAAISGEMEGSPLRMVPAIQATWKFWRTRHPDTLVVIPDGERRRPYYYRQWTPGTPRPRTTGHDTTRLGLGLALGGEAWFFPLSELAGVETPIRVELANRTVTVHHDAVGLTAWAEDEQGRLLAGVMAYREGWFDFHPRSRAFRSP